MKTYFQSESPSASYITTKGKTDAQVQVTAPRWRPVSAVCFSNYNVPVKSKELTYIKLRMQMQLAAVR